MSLLPSRVYDQNGVVKPFEAYTHAMGTWERSIDSAHCRELERYELCACRCRCKRSSLDCICICMCVGGGSRRLGARCALSTEPADRDPLEVAKDTLIKGLSNADRS